MVACLASWREIQIQFIYWYSYRHASNFKDERASWSDADFSSPLKYYLHSVCVFMYICTKGKVSLTLPPAVKCIASSVAVHPVSSACYLLLKNNWKIAVFYTDQDLLNISPRTYYIVKLEQLCKYLGRWWTIEECYVLMYIRVHIDRGVVNPDF